MSGDIKISRKNKNLKRLMQKNETDKTLSNAFSDIDMETKNSMKADIQLIKEISNEIYNRNKYIASSELHTEVIRILRNSGFKIDDVEEQHIRGAIKYLVDTKQIKKDSRVIKFLKKVGSILLLCVI
jgi:uncharacterized membrane protein YheB (UPF0754 family)